MGTIQMEDTTITQQAILDLVAMPVVVMAVVMEQTRVNNKGGGIKTKEVEETDTSPTRSSRKAYPTSSTPREDFVFTYVLQNIVDRTVVVVNTPCTEREKVFHTD